MIFIFFYIMTDICPICIETYSKVQRFKTTCFNCDFEACRKCIRHYVIESSNNQVNCMNCKTTWNDKYISSALLPAFFKNQYKLHTNKNSIDSQLALLPSTQPEVEDIIQRKNANLKQIDIQIKIYNLNTQLKDLEKTKIKEFIKTIRNNINTSITNKFNEEKLKPFKNRIKKSEITNLYSLDKQTIKKNAYTMYNESKETDPTYIQIHQKINELNTTNNELTNLINKSVKKSENKIYNRPCSFPSCNGMLRQNSDLCGICNNITCSKCLQYYNIDNTTHVCNEDDIKTAKLIKKDTKYCPKCSFGITKISGCDVMFCTQCTTSFNWKTMEILTKNLHNPHYLEYLRRAGTTRDRDNITNNCIANPTITDFDTRRLNNIRSFCDNIQLFRAFTPIITNGVYSIQYILHITDNINTIQTKINNLEDLNRTTRIKLLLNEIDRSKFDEIVSKNCYELRILTQKIQITSTIRDISTELIFNISNNELMAINNSIFNILDSFNTNTFTKISNKSEEFFNNYISITKFTEVMNQLDTIITEIKKIAKYCIDEDIQLSKLYGRSQNYGLRHYLL